MQKLLDQGLQQILCVLVNMCNFLFLGNFLLIELRNHKYEGWISVP